MVSAVWATSAFAADHPPLAKAPFSEQQAQEFEDDRLQVDADANNESSQKLDEKNWGRERKKVKEQQYKIQNQRAPIGKSKQP